MRDEEIERTIKRPETPNFNELVNREVSLTKFAACSAQSIMIAANRHGITYDEAIIRVTKWIDLLKAKGINPMTPFDEGSDGNVN